MSTTNTESNADSLADDLMIGLGPIGEFWGFTDKWQTRRMLQYMPGVFRLGKHWCQRKSVARKGIEERERQIFPLPPESKTNPAWRRGWLVAAF